MINKRILADSNRVPNRISFTAMRALKVWWLTALLAHVSQLCVTQTHFTRCRYPSTISTTGVLIEEPVLKKIGDAHGLTPAQVVLSWNWQKGIVFNPRTFNTTHMRENMDMKIFTTEFMKEGASRNSARADALHSIALRCIHLTHHMHRCLLPHILQ